MADIHFEDNSFEVKDAMNSAVIAFLHEAAGELEAQVKRNTSVDTGQLKNSWTHHVDKSSQTATIGSPLELAIWREFGTGEWALNGNGRKTPWSYKDRHGNWHTTTGNKPERAFWRAFENIKPKLQKALESKLKGLGK
jgi:hypothetical protein